MKVSALVRMTTKIEVEVNDKFSPLSNDEFWSGENWETAITLSQELANEIENMPINKRRDVEVGAVYDKNGAILFET